MAKLELRALYEQINSDERRTHFSPDIEDAHDKVLAPGADSDAIAQRLLAWIGEYQPCLFGKIAARQNRLRVCVLTEDDFVRPDPEVRDRIQAARESCWRDGFYGHVSGMVLAAISDRLATAAPDTSLAEFSRRLCELYLLQDISLDVSHTESMYLEKPGPQRRTWKWLAGVNFFGGAGDGRWWHDHRFPGGVAFSMNSVGHLVKSGAIAEAMAALDTRLGIDDGEEWTRAHVTSLDKALVMAMRTIRVSSEGIRPGTRLIHNSHRAPALACPVDLPPDLRGHNHCSYFGEYHTDHTLPSDYFGSAVDKPTHVPNFQDLDFTYLFDRSLDDFVTMATGVRVRADEADLEAETDEGEQRAQKRRRVAQQEVAIDDEPSLRAALARAGR
jgi:hypothetical protein